MKIEDEIKQEQFKSMQHKAIINILFTAGWLNAQTHELLKPHAISQQQFNILRILRGQHPKPASVNLLIDRMLDKMSNASRLVEKLRQKGLVERQPCEQDRRQVDVAITKKGLQLLKELDTQFEALEGDFGTITDKDAETLNELLDKLRS